jgi:hypothetical protein
MTAARFVGAALAAAPTYVTSAALSAGEPPLPSSFRWLDIELPVLDVLATWRSTKNDRGDDYLAKHWYEIRTVNDRRAVIYFDRKARSGQPRWWLYTITDE